MDPFLKMRLSDLRPEKAVIGFTAFGQALVTTLKV